MQSVCVWTKEKTRSSLGVARQGQSNPVRFLRYKPMRGLRYCRPTRWFSRSKPNSRTTLKQANSLTLGTFFSPRMWWVDIEVPNDFVDVSSWKSSACYPRRTFYPLSDGLSTKYHRITMTDLRLCLTCKFHSQAGLCHYTRKLITDQFEPTFVRLRYSLGDNRPS